MPNKALVFYTLKSALRDRLIFALALFLVVGSSLSVFFGTATAIEQQEFTMVFASGGLRIAAVLALVLFVAFYIRRSIDSKDMEFILSRPVSRVSYLLSTALALLILSLCLSSAVAICLLLLTWNVVDPSMVGLWSVSLFVELGLVSFVAFFFAMVLSSASAVSMASFAFYILARLIGQILGIIDVGEGNIVLSRIMEMISMIVPRFDLMGQTSWLVYGLEESSPIGLVYILVHGAAFGILVLMATLIDLTRKQF